MKRQHLVVAAILLAAASLISGTCNAETQGEFLRNKNNYAKNSAQYHALSATPQH